jgi:hypothetical protein
MNLIDRYIREVGRHLPRKNRADIQAELHSLLVDSLEARVEGEPTEEDVINLLKEFGPPEKVAASYWKEGQYLIGPRLYPFFRMVVSIVLIVFVAVQLVLLGIGLVFNQATMPTAGWIGEFFGGIFGAFGIIVLVFAVLQRLGVQPEMEEEAWDPRSLPKDEDDDPISVWGTIIETAFGFILIAILLFLPDQIGAYTSLRGELISNPVLQENLLIIILAILLGIGLDLFLLWKGQWSLFTRLAKIGINLFVIYVLYQLVVEHTSWLAAHNASGFFETLEAFPQGAAPSPEFLQLLVMQSFRLAFGIALIVLVIETLNLIYKLIKKTFFSPKPPVTIPAG